MGWRGNEFEIGYIDFGDNNVGDNDLFGRFVANRIGTNIDETIWRMRHLYKAIVH